MDKVQTDEYWDFGWQHFTAADRTSKENYLGYLIHGTLTNLIGETNADIVTDALFDNRKGLRSGVASTLRMTPMSQALGQNGYGVDHQSRLIFPANWDGKGANLEFFEDFRRYFLENPVVVLGGNDNSDDEHPLAGEGKRIDFGLPEDGSATADLVARRDTVDGVSHWVLFNRSTGAKVRLTFDSYPTGRVARNPANQATVEASRFMQGPQKPVLKAEVPELVDIKITDFCPAGCKFCYQGSSPNGVHAKTQDLYGKSMGLYSLIYDLAQMRVFEVALGGGEPTFHPDFLSILKSLRAHGIVPNFSTRSLAWLGHSSAGQIAEACGSFAYSVSTGKDVKALERALHKAGLDRLLEDGDKVAVQYVLNTGGDLYGVLEEARKSLDYSRVTILGFKRAGLGKGFQEIPEDWVSTVRRVRREHSGVPIGVDTLVVQQHGEELRGKLGVQDALMTGGEGKFSMYIDAVSGMMGPSSYCDPSLMVPLLEPKVTGGARATHGWIGRKFQEW
jgi:hypothetical protein